MKSSFITGPNFQVCGFGENFSQDTFAGKNFNDYIEYMDMLIRVLREKILNHR